MHTCICRINVILRSEFVCSVPIFMSDNETHLQYSQKLPVQFLRVMPELFLSEVRICLLNSYNYLARYIFYSEVRICLLSSRVSCQNYFHLRFSAQYYGIHFVCTNFCVHDLVIVNYMLC